jgi:hypothetical protein
MHSSRSHDAVIFVYDATGNVIEAHKHKGYRRVKIKKLLDVRRLCASHAYLVWEGGQFFGHEVGARVSPGKQHRIKISN